MKCIKYMVSVGLALLCFLQVNAQNPASLTIHAEEAELTISQEEVDEVMKDPVWVRRNYLRNADGVVSTPDEVYDPLRLPRATQTDIPRERIYRSKEGYRPYIVGPDGTVEYRADHTLIYYLYGDNTIFGEVNYFKYLKNPIGDDIDCQFMFYEEIFADLFESDMKYAMVSMRGTYFPETGMSSQFDYLFAVREDDKVFPITYPETTQLPTITFAQANKGDNLAGKFLLTPGYTLTGEPATEDLSAGAGVRDTVQQLETK